MNATKTHVPVIDLRPVRPMTRQKSRKSVTAQIVAPFESMNETNNDFLRLFHIQKITPIHSRAIMTFSGKAKNATGKSPARN